MYSISFVFISLTFSCIVCVQRDVVSDLQEKHFLSDIFEKENYASSTLELNHGNVEIVKRDVAAKHDTGNTKQGDNPENEQVVNSAPSVKKKDLDNPMQNTTIVNNSTIEHPEEKGKSFSPAAQKRGAVVFAGLTLCALIYLTFKLYRNKQSKSEGVNIFPSTEAPQFRYGVLKSDDNMELSNLPLNMESDEEDDLHLFDLEQSKREQRMSTSNLRTFSDDNDGRSDIEVLNLDLPLPGARSRSDEKSHLLLDIDDEMTDPSLPLPSILSKT